MAMFSTASGDPIESAGLTCIPLVLPSGVACVSSTVLVPSWFSTSTARSPSNAVGLTLTSAVITPEFTTVELTTLTSPACVCPVESPSAASGGEITTVAPGLKFAPSSVMLTRSTPTVVNPGCALVSCGEAASTTVSCTVFDGVDNPPFIFRTVIFTAPGVAMSEAKIGAVSSCALTNVVARLAPFT